MNVARLSTASIGVLAILVLSGCAPAPAPAPAPVAEQPIASTPTSALSPTPTPTPAAQVDPLQVSADGVGYLTIGEPVPTDAAEPIVTWDANDCDWNSGGGLWQPAPGYGEKWTRGWMIFTLGKSDPVTDLWVFDEKMKTAEGIHPGSTEEDLLATYPDLEHVSKGWSEIYVLAGERGELIFEVPSDADAWSDSPEKLGTVVWMLVGELGGPRGSIAFGDATPCDWQ